MGWFASLGTTGGHVAATLSTCIALFAIPVWVVLIILSTKRMRRLMIMLTVAYPLMLLANVEIGARLSPEYITQKQGRIIINALDQYYRANGRYPPTLNTLVPTFLDKIPETRISYIVNSVSHPDIKKWDYTTALQEGGFTLGFWYRDDGFKQCVYVSETEEWTGMWEETCFFTFFQ